MRLLSIKSVLVATDLDPSSIAALESARTLVDSSGAELHVVHVDAGGASAADVEGVLRQARVPPSRAAVHILDDDPARGIVHLADTLDADVIVLGPHRNETDEATIGELGSTALAVVTNAAVPCLVAKRGLRLPLDHVVVGIDMSDTARGALLVGLSWASGLRATGTSGESVTKLSTLHVRRSADSPPEVLEQAIARLRGDAGSWAGVSIEPQWVTGDSVAGGIAHFAIDYHAGLVVLGTRGLGLDRIGRLGSVSAAVMQQLSAPVLLVPPAIWTEYASAG